MISKTETDPDMEFYKEYGWASCFECDEIFTDLDELYKHQEKHIIEEQCLSMKEK